MYIRNVMRASLAALTLYMCRWSFPMDSPSGTSSVLMKIMFPIFILISLLSVFIGENDKKAHVIASRVVSGLLLISGVVLAVLHYTLWADADET